MEKIKKGFTPSNFLSINLRGFTFIEILVVVTIIALLAAGASVSYSAFIKQSRDAKRKADLEQIRSAVEMYRSNNNKYPNTADGNSINLSNCNPAGTVADATSTYLSKIPNDPKCSSGTPIYYYSSADGSTYTVGTKLEVVPSSGSTCGGCGSQCNYCLGPYGQL